ncbi:MAG TPA: ABC transporter substrate-binding protein [Stellaceae bacterium]|nr:ABC transporter substrate-binding protein [Stellaceae bacterium]
MRRRVLLQVIAGIAISPATGIAQERKNKAVIGILMNLASTDPEGQARVRAFVKGLEAFGWVDGENIHIEYRWAAAGPESIAKYAEELVGLQPDVIMASTSGVMPALLKMTRTVPIIFTQVIDPVGAGFVNSLSRPGGNATGFVAFEYGIAVKWLELLEQLVPKLNRVGIIRDPLLAAGIGQYATVQALAPTRGIELSPIDPRDMATVERELKRLGETTGSGLIVSASPTVAVHRREVIALAEEHKIPTVYYTRYYVDDGGLISYGTYFIEQYERAADYVNRVLKGTKPAELPVQGPTKFELVLNMKTARKIGLTIPPAIVGRADELIE